MFEKMAATSIKKGKSKDKGSGGGPRHSNPPSASKDKGPSNFKAGGGTGGGRGKMKPLEAPKMGLLAQHEARMAAKVLQCT